MIVETSISCSDIQDMNPRVPMEVQIRILLNKRGFKFEDDGSCAIIVNREPVPLGQLDRWDDPRTGRVHYRQTL